MRTLHNRVHRPLQYPHRRHQIMHQDHGRRRKHYYHQRLSTPNIARNNGPRHPSQRLRHALLQRQYANRFLLWMGAQVMSIISSSKYPWCPVRYLLCQIARLRGSNKPWLVSNPSHASHSLTPTVLPLFISPNHHHVYGPHSNVYTSITAAFTTCQPSDVQLSPSLVDAPVPFFSLSISPIPPSISLSPSCFFTTCLVCHLSSSV